MAQHALLCTEHAQKPSDGNGRDRVRLDKLDWTLSVRAHTRMVSHSGAEETRAKQSNKQGKKQGRAEQSKSFATS